MEVRRGLVYPHQTLLDDVQIDASIYAMIKLDMVHENSKNLKLEVTPDDTTLTLHLAICFCMLSVFVCCLYRYSVTVKSWQAPGCSRQPGCP
jgi:hypothetical protein